MPEKRGQNFSYETYKEGEDIVLGVDAEECPFFPSIEDNAMCMSAVIDKLVESPGITRVVFAQKRDYEYGYEQVRMLAELGKLRNQIIKQQVLLSMSSVSGMFQGPIGERRSYEMRNIIYNKLRNDPVAAYIELRRIHREEKIAQERNKEGPAKPEHAAAASDRYLQLVESLLNALEKTELIARAKPHLQEYKEGDRGV